MVKWRRRERGRFDRDNCRRYEEAFGQQGLGWKSDLGQRALVNLGLSSRLEHSERAGLALTGRPTGDQGRDVIETGSCLAGATLQGAADYPWK